MCLCVFINYNEIFAKAAGLTIYTVQKVMILFQRVIPVVVFIVYPTPGRTADVSVVALDVFVLDKSKNNYVGTGSVTITSMNDLLPRIIILILKL